MSERFCAVAAGFVLQNLVNQPRTAPKTRIRVELMPNVAVKQFSPQLVEALREKCDIGRKFGLVFLRKPEVFQLLRAGDIEHGQASKKKVTSQVPHLFTNLLKSFKVHEGDLLLCNRHGCAN